MDKVYVLRNCKNDLSSRDGFVYPESGYVECPDWKDTKECGNGLHGFLWGVGDSSLLYNTSDCKWLIIEVEKDLIVDLEGKVKFPYGNVVFCTDSRYEVIEKMIEFGANPNTIMYNTSISDNHGTSTSGERGNSTSGNHGTSISGKVGTSISGYSGISTSGLNGGSISGLNGTSISGNYGNSISGNSGISTSGYYGISTSGNHGTSISYYNGTSISGYNGNSTSGKYGTSISGDHGTSISGNKGTSTSGFRGTSISGNYGDSYSRDGKVKTGDRGVVIISYYDKKNDRQTAIVGHVGNDPDDLKPNTVYKQLNGKFVECEEE